MKKYYILAAGSVIVINLLITLPVLAAAPFVVRNIGIQDRVGGFWTDPTGNALAITGYSPLAANYEFLGGTKDSFVSKLAFKITNSAFIPAIDKVYLFYRNETAFKKKTSGVQREAKVMPSGLVSFNLGASPLFVPAKKISGMAVRLLLKNDAGGVPSGTTTTVVLASDADGQSLTTDLRGNDRFKKKFNGEMIDIFDVSPPNLILRHAAVKVQGACKFLGCEFDDKPEPIVGYFYFSADRQVWNKVLTSNPSVQSFNLRLSGSAIAAGKGDNSAVVSVYTANYPEPIKLGEVTVPYLDNGNSGYGQFILPSPFIISNGSRLVWFTVNSRDDDFVLGSPGTSDLTAQIAGYTWSDGEVNNLNGTVWAKDLPVSLSTPVSRPKISVKVRPQRINNVQNLLVDVSIKGDAPIHGIDIYVGDNDTKAALPLVKHCNGNATNGIAKCQYLVPWSKRHSGFYYIHAIDDNNITAETALGYFNL